MLKKNALKHFEFIKALIIEGAQSGVFNPELASSKGEARFFTDLSTSLKSGTMTNSQAPEKLAAYVYFNSVHHATNPLGFILLKGDDNLTELWMAAIDAPYRGKGLGKLMIQEAIQTLQTRNIVCRCSPGSHVAMQILTKQGFVYLGKGKEGTSFVVGGRMAPALQAKLKEHFSS